MLTTPVLLIAFNRPSETSLVLEAIKKAAPQKLYVAVDGPRISKPTDEEKCKRVKQILSTIDWNCDVKYLFHEENQGCYKAVSCAINWFFDTEEQGIILEDDCVPSQDFFFFCEELLEKYKNDNNVISINGSNFGYEEESAYSYFFTNYMNMWGWATWRRCLDLVDYELIHWNQVKHKNLYLFTKLFKHYKSFDWPWVQYLRYQFDTIVSNNIDTWDYQWLYAQLHHEKLSVVPTRNLVSNVGFGVNAHHTVDIYSPASNLPAKQLKFPLKHPNNYLVNKIFERDYVKGVWANQERKSLIKQFKDILKYYVNKI